METERAAKSMDDTATVVEENILDNDNDKDSDNDNDNDNGDVEGVQEQVNEGQQSMDDNQTDNVTSDDSNHDNNENAPTKTNETKSEVPLLQQLPKKARTAYFIYMAEQRPKVQQQQSNKNVAAVAKVIGQMWKDLSEDDKALYRARAKKEKETYAQQMELWKTQMQHGPNEDTANRDRNGTANSTTPKSDPTATILPVARIRKICKLDPDVRGISKEATLLVTKAAELFTAKLANETNSMARLQKRRKLVTKDVVDVASLRDAFFFMREDMNDFIKFQQREQLKENELRGQRGGGGGGGTDNVNNKGRVGTKLAAATKNVKPLTSYFGKK